MPRPWMLLDSVDTPEGMLELRRRGDGDFMISIAGRVLMTSMITRSELALAELGLTDAARQPAPKVLVGGLGLGFTLRAALDALPARASLTVAELNPAVVRWCREQAAEAAGRPLQDPRVQVHQGDVMEVMDSNSGTLNAILIDLYVGPEEGPRQERHPIYGRRALERAHTSLQRGGLYAIWGEEPSTSFEKRLGRVGFEVELQRTRGHGVRHAVYLARKP